jgi:hypothetical protein
MDLKLDHMKTMIIISVLVCYTIAGYSKDPDQNTSGTGFDATPTSDVFRSTYGVSSGVSDFSGTSIQQTTDGGFISTGYTSNFGAGNEDIYLLKTSSTGDIQWTASFGGPAADDGNFVVQTSDGGYAITGVTSSFGGRYIFLLKTDQNGTLTWTKVYGSSTIGSNSSASSLQQTDDGGFLLAGNTSNFGAGMDDFYLLKTDSNGNLLWTKTYGGLMNDDATFAAQTSDGGYIIAGTTSSFGNQMGNILLVKTDGNGGVLWAKVYDSDLNDALEKGFSVKETTDYGYIIAGSLVSTSEGVNALLIKTDVTGQIQWFNIFNNVADGSDLIFTSTKQLSDGGFIATGYIDNFSTGYDNFYLLRTSSNGNMLWTRTYGSTSNDVANCVGLTNDGGFILAGKSVGSLGNKYLSVIKTDSGGNTTCDQFVSDITLRTDINIFANDVIPMVSSGGMFHTVSVVSASGGTILNVCGFFGVGDLTNQGNKVTVYPNPSPSNVTFHLESNEQNPVLHIYDMTGLQIVQITFSGKEIVLGQSDLPEGMYFFRIQSNGGLVGSGKFIIE